AELLLRRDRLLGTAASLAAGETLSMPGKSTNQAVIGAFPRVPQGMPQRPLLLPRCHKTVAGPRQLRLCSPPGRGRPVISWQTEAKSQSQSRNTQTGDSTTPEPAPT